MDQLQPDLLREFDNQICEDMEYTGECIPQWRLKNAANNFEDASIIEYICLRQHPCCRARLAKYMLMLKPSSGQTLEDVLTDIVRFFVNPVDGELGIHFYVQQSLPKEDPPPSWFKNQECIPDQLVFLFEEHMHDPVQELVSIADVQAICSHIQTCDPCKENISTIPTVALSSL